MREFKNIYFFRHGETDWNKARRIQGTSDIPLNVTGRMQAESVIRFIDDYKIDIIYSSTLSRALDTANIASSGRGIEVIPDARFKEVFFGEKEGAYIDSEYDGEIETFIKKMHPDYDDVRMTGGESKVEALNRAMEALEEIVLTRNEKSIAIFFHATLISIILTSLGEYHKHAIGNAQHVAIKAHADDDDNIEWKILGVRG